MWVKKPQLEPDIEQWTGSKLAKEYIKAVYLSPSLFNFCAEYIVRNGVQDEAEAESGLLEEISVTSHMQMTTPL